MKFEEIEKLLQFNENESKVFMPNEIFEDLKETITNSPHLAFAYSYYYLITWLYRHTKYGCFHIDNSEIKKVLGYNSITKGLDYLIKKNGVFDQMGYTNTVKDFPTLWTFEDGLLEFELLSETDEMYQLTIKENLSRKYTIKFPIKAFYRHINDEELKEEYAKDYQDGTFYEIENTHCIPFEVFMYCMGNDQIGTIGFYLYSYIKRMNDIYKNGWDISIEDMIKATGLTKNTLDRYLDKLRKYKLIEVEHNQDYFCLALKIEERKANTYRVNEFDSFAYKPQFYKKIKRLTVDEYQKIKEEEFLEMWGRKADIPLEELPY